MYATGLLDENVVRLGTLTGLVQKADKGTYGTSQIPLDDPDGTLVIAPFRAFSVDETACPAPRIGKFYITERTWARADSLITGRASRIEVSLIDLNAVLYMKLITHSTFHYKRPAETDAARIAWLLAHVLNTIVVEDNGLVDTSDPVSLAAVDYTGQFPIQVLNDCANRSGKNFFIYADAATSANSLAYFKSRDASIYVSDLSISNDLADESSTCFLPLADLSMTNDPSLVYDGVYMPYNGGAVYVRSAGRYLARDVVGPSANTSDRARAITLASRMLANHDSEDSTVTCSIRVPAAQVNLLKSGMLVNAKFVHLPGWEAGLDVRVLELAVKQDEQTNASYVLTVTLGHPVLVNFTTGGSPDNTRGWPSGKLPFATGSGAFSFVQSAAQADDTTTPTATYGTDPTEGNLLVATMLAETNGGALDTSEFLVTFPDGWTLDVGPVGHIANNRLQAVWIAHKIAGPSEPATVAPGLVIGGASAQGGYVVLAEYAVAGGTPEVAGVLPGAFSGPSNTADLAEFSPLPGGALIVQGVAHEPNYNSTYSAGWTNRGETTTGGDRQAIALVDQILVATGAPVAGVATVAGTGESNWFIPAVLFSASGDEPSLGQPIAPESAVGDGATSAYTTNYPYAPGSLEVFVGGVHAIVTETDPAAGLFAFVSPVPDGVVATWTYLATDPTPTGASNPPPTPADPTVPFALLGSGGDGSGANVLHDDGTWAPESGGGGATIFVPLTTTLSGDPVLVWDADDELVLTEVPRP